MACISLNSAAAMVPPAMRLLLLAISCQTAILRI